MEALRLPQVLVKPRKTAQQCSGGKGGWCCPWLIPAGKLVSAHRAQRPPPLQRGWPLWAVGGGTTAIRGGGGPL